MRPLADGGRLEAGDYLPQGVDLGVQRRAPGTRGAQPGAGPTALDYLLDADVAGFLKPADIAREIAVSELEGGAQVREICPAALAEDGEDS